MFLPDDLYPEHVFVDPPRSEATGLIDWADAAWGDPANDVSLIGWLLGDSCLDAAIEGYGSPEPEELRMRAVCRGTMVGIYDVEVAEPCAPNVPLGPRIAVPLGPRSGRLVGADLTVARWTAVSPRPGDGAERRAYGRLY